MAKFYKKLKYKHIASRSFWSSFTSSKQTTYLIILMVISV